MRMAISTLLEQPANWRKISLVSKNIQGSQDVHSPIPNSWICSNYRLGLPLQISSTSANQSWGTQFQHKEIRRNLQNLKSLLSNRQNTASMTESGPMSPWMDSATLPIQLPFISYTPCFTHYTHPDSATPGKAVAQRKQDSPSHSWSACTKFEAGLGLFHKQALNATMVMHRKKYLYITKVKFDKAIKYSLSSPSYTSISMLIIFVFSLIQLTYKAIKQILETR